MKNKIAIFSLILLFLSGCASPALSKTPTAAPSTEIASLPNAENESQPVNTEIPLPTMIPAPVVRLAEALPDGLHELLKEQYGLENNPKEEANLRLEWTEEGTAEVEWVYVLVTPFSSLIEQVDFETLKNWWQGKSGENTTSIYVTADTARALEPLLGRYSPNHVSIVEQNQLLESAWQQRDVVAIVPFEELEPRWKVIALNEQSPITNHFEKEVYPLILRYRWVGEEAVLQKLLNEGKIPALITNRDENRLTVLVMTGVTALVRATAVRMEQKGMTYPGEDIGNWLREADLTHISNEVSFSPQCPDPKMDPFPLVFCSKPQYIELLDSVGTDIVDLTGNHGVDWGRDALTYSLDLYRSRGWVYYAAGENLNEARDAAFIEHNGNRFAFLGCNPAGPAYIWAGEDFGGVAPCDYDWIQSRIRQLKAEGYIVIFTFQYFETYRHWVMDFEREDFHKPADAGAVIVSGSQAHHPMAMEFYGDTFIHYGLGNLFFDQMWVDTVTIPEGTRKEFIDRHVFYNGKHISTELLTAYLEDYARPRPMNASERYDFLREIFTAAGWGPYNP